MPLTRVTNKKTFTNLYQRYVLELVAEECERCRVPTLNFWLLVLLDFRPTAESLYQRLTLPLALFDCCFPRQIVFVLTS